MILGLKNGCGGIIVGRGSDHTAPGKTVHPAGVRLLEQVSEDTVRWWNPEKGVGGRRGMHLARVRSVS